MDAGSSLACPHCGRRFPIEGGIAAMLPLRPAGSAAAESASADEERQRDREARAYDRLIGLRLLSRAEIPATINPLRVSPGTRAIDAGCGTGRMTLPLLARGAEVIAVDRSRESLRVLAGKLPQDLAGRALLVQAEVTCLPVRDDWASVAVSAQVLEHLPEPDLRRLAVSELRRVLSPGGRAALSAYWRVPLLGPLLPTEGRHSGAIFFHRFTRRELRELLDPALEVERLSARLGYVLLAHVRRAR